MRQLRLVHRTEDGTLVVETTDGDEQFGLPIDAVLRTAIRADQPRPSTEPQTMPGATAKAVIDDPPPIGPREIQVRVRAGESPEELAEAYDMPLDKVLRFAGPVMDERRRIADESRRARARRGTPEGQIVVFGEAVDERFAAHGIAPENVMWDARRRDDGEWIVTAEWDGGGFAQGRHAAEWVFSRVTRSVSPSDETATDLLSDRPIRPVAPPEPTQRPSLAAAPPLRAGIVAFPPMPDAHTAPVAVVEEVFDQEADGDESSTDSSAAASATRAPVDLPYETRPLDQVDATLDFDAPPLPLGIVDADGRPADTRFGRSRDARRESEEERAARARVPSWDDILLGVRRKD